MWEDIDILLNLKDMRRYRHLVNLKDVIRYRHLVKLKRCDKI